MRGWIKKALTRKVAVKGVRGKVQQVEIPPNPKLLYGMSFAVIALICLTVLEATYMLVLRSFSSEIFAAITLVTGTILGALFSNKA